MGCQSIAGLPPALNLLVPIYTPGWTEAIAVVTLRTFALGKLDLLTVLPRET